jgi:hypothetical protein
LGPILGGEWSFPFYDEEILRKNVFRPLFELPADPEAEEEPIDDDIEEEGADYLVNVRHGSDHEVHKTSCVFLPTKEENRCFLGWYETLDDAMEAALWEVPGRSVDGCYWCCRERHTT